MTGYYLYHLHPNGRINGRDIVEADTDEAAVERAYAASRGDPMELWEGARAVKTFPRGARNRPDRAGRSKGTPN